MNDLSMRKEVFLLIFLLFGLSYHSHAGTGYADDGFNLILVLSGLLLVVVALLSGTDWLKKNGKAVTRQVVTFLSEKIDLLKEHLHEARSFLYY
jgi:hypothetical protein